MATIFEQDELKYTQTDIDVRDAKIRELEKALAEAKDELRKYKVHAKQVRNSQWGGMYIDDKSVWYDSMRSNVYNYN